MKKHPEILITRADKANITVALNNKKYTTNRGHFI